MSRVQHLAFDVLFSVQSGKQGWAADDPNLAFWAEAAGCKPSAIHSLTPAEAQHLFFLLHQRGHAQ